MNGVNCDCPANTTLNTDFDICIANSHAVSDCGPGMFGTPPSCYDCEEGGICTTCLDPNGAPECTSCSMD